MPDEILSPLIAQLSELRTNEKEGNFEAKIGALQLSLLEEKIGNVLVQVEANRKTCEMLSAKEAQRVDERSLERNHSVEGHLTALSNLSDERVKTRDVEIAGLRAQIEALSRMNNETTRSSVALFDQKFHAFEEAFTEFKLRNDAKQETMNEIRNQLNVQAATFQTKEVAEAQAKSFVTKEGFEGRMSVVVTAKDLDVRDARSADSARESKKSNWQVAAAVAAVVGVAIGLISNFGLRSAAVTPVAIVAPVAPVRP